jgi:PAS domain S-box-containing protein
MRPALEASPDSQTLRRYLRDLASLTDLPAAWITADRRQIAEELAGILAKVLDPGIVYVRLGAPRGGEDFEALRLREGLDLPDQGRSIRCELDSLLPRGLSAVTVLPLPHDAQGNPMKAAVAPVGYGCELGILMAASGEPGFPAEEHCLLLGVAANQAATVLQHQQAGEFQSLLAAIIESSEDAIISKTLDGVITSWNGGAERLFGYAAAEAVGRPITLVIPLDRHHEEHSILERLRRGERIEHYETLRQRKTGELIEVSLAISPVRDNSGRIVGASKVARDITLAKRAEEALKDADRRKDEFLAMLAHELRTPLAPLRNAVAILSAKGPEVPELAWAREVIERQVRQMTRLVDDLLDVSRITRGKIALRKERVDLAAVVGNAVEAVRPLVDEAGHRLTVALPAEPILLEADPLRLSQVLLNLLSNAAKYTNPGGDIQLTVERERDAVSIRVRDDGIGIEPEMLPRVFDMFAQEEQSLERSQGGLGIGLTLVQRLVKLHGGMVTAHSEGRGKGTEMVVRLPAAEDEGDHPPQAMGEAEAATAAGAPRRRILVVDDNQDAAESLALLLQMWGHEVQVVFDGPAAIQSAAAFRPDMVLLDIGLPEMNGYEVARRIRLDRGDGVALIALTGWGQDEDRRRSHEAGFDHHLTKPVEIEALQQVIAANGE